jgi:uncharacterized protein YkwD
VAPVFRPALITYWLRICLLFVGGGSLLLARFPALAAEAVAITPKPSTPGQTVTLKWYFTGTKVLVSGGRFGKGVEVTGRTTLTDTPQKTTRYTFDVWYPDPKSTAAPKTLIHTQYTATAEVGEALKEPTEEQITYQVLELVNKERAINNLPPLHLHLQLQAASHWMAQDMANNDYLDHTDHEGRELEGRLSAFDYKDYQAIGENVAAGQTTAALVMEGWMQSPGHRSNILSPEFCEIGIGHLVNPSSKFRHYWAQDFGRQQDNYPVVINNGACRCSQCNVKLYIYGEGSMKQTRLSNDGVVWTDWEAYQPSRDWTLPVGSGKRTVYVELKDGKHTYRSSENIEIVPEKSPPAPSISIRK